MIDIAPRINIVTLGVRDLPRSVAFYEALGWVRSSASNEAIAFFDLNGTKLALFGRKALAEDAGVDSGPEGEAEEDAFRAVTLALNFATEEEVDRAFDRFLAAGAILRKKAQKVHWGGYSGYVADPDGHLWELAHNPFAPLDENGHLDLGG